ncbi:MAG: geranylgeranylglyceryl/heptaprenylglyceryl phosphate synthase [Candidatus Eisenbacteria bacterium]
MRTERSRTTRRTGKDARPARAAGSATSKGGGGGSAVGGPGRRDYRSRGPSAGGPGCGAVFERLLSVSAAKGSAFLVLVDPDKIPLSGARHFVSLCVEAGADGFLVGGSLTFSENLDEFVFAIKKHSGLPTLLFPGNAGQISRRADAILFLSLLSSRNPDFLIGEQVRAAPLVHKFGLEVIPTAYLLVESGPLTSVLFMSQSLPIPREKCDLAVAHALAGKYLGMKLIYLEAGSGASAPVPREMVEAVSTATGLPVAVGGGVRSAKSASAIAGAGARFVVVGNALEETADRSFLNELASAIHFLDK